MPLITLKAHYDGKHIVPDEHLELAPNARLTVTVRPLDQHVGRRGKRASEAPTSASTPSFFTSCLVAARTAAVVPPDLSENVDAYLYGGKTLLPS